MKWYLRSALVGTAAAIVANTSHADGPESDLADRIAALEAMVAELKAELDQERAELDGAVVRIEQAETIMDSDRPTTTVEGFVVGDATFKIGGFIDVDSHVTNFSDGAVAGGSIARDFHIPGATPIGGEGTTVTDLTAEATRIYITADQTMGNRKVGGRLEMDFLGSLQGNERVSNSFSPRLRRAFLTVDNVLVGQEWTTFQNTSAIPESASFLILSDGMVFIRQAQVRYTAGPWQFAIENGDATITPVGGGRIEADSNMIPDVVARYNLTGNFGNVSLAGIGRQLRIDTGFMDEETFGFGLAAQGRINIGKRDDLRFTLVGGEGVGRYVGLNSVNGAIVDPITGDLEAIPVYGGLIAWRHPFGETARFNIGYSGLFADNPDFTPGGQTKQTQSIYSAILWDAAPRVTMGGEVLFGIRENEAGDEGEITRFTFSTKYAF